jgi:hypothetical protein
MAFLTESECRKAARDGGYGEPTMGAKQSTAGYRVHGLHGMKTPSLAGSYWTKAEAMRAAQQAANEEGEPITISTPGKAPWITVQPRAGAKDALPGPQFRVGQVVQVNVPGESFHSSSGRIVATESKAAYGNEYPVWRVEFISGPHKGRTTTFHAEELRATDALPGGFMTTQTETCDRATRLHAALDCVMDRRMAKATDAGPFTVKVGSHYINPRRAHAATGASDRAFRLHRALDCIMDRKARAKDDEGASRKALDWYVVKPEYSVGVATRGVPVGTRPTNVNKIVSGPYDSKSEAAFEARKYEFRAQEPYGAKDADGKLLGTGNGFEYWQVGDDVFRNQVGNRGPMEGGKPSNARWECSIAHYNRFKESVLGVAADKASGLTAEDDGFLRSLLEGATGLAKAGLGAMSPGDGVENPEDVRRAEELLRTMREQEKKPAYRAGVAKNAPAYTDPDGNPHYASDAKDRAGRLHRALDCVLDRKLARR